MNKCERKARPFPDADHDACLIKDSFLSLIIMVSTITLYEWAGDRQTLKIYLNAFMTKY